MSIFRKYGHSILTVIIFVLFSGICFFMNLPAIEACILSKLSIKNIQVLNSAESSFQNSVWKRIEAIDIHGRVLDFLQMNVVGRLEFVRDDAGFIQMFDKGGNDFSSFLSSMEHLKQYTENEGIPLIYISNPDKGINLKKLSDSGYRFEGQVSSLIGKELAERGVDLIDLDALVNCDSPEISYKEFFFRTDVHHSSRGEFYMLEKLVQHMERKYDIKFPYSSTVLDLQNYQITQHAFVGNTARSVGRYYVGEDVFEIYTPRWDTDLSFIDDTGNVIREGSFEETVLNDYDLTIADDPYRYYWVTNFGFFSCPRYSYVNKNNSEGPKVLMISDSGSMRMFSYLSLMSSKVTVLDPRYFGENKYLTEELENERYDLIVVAGISSDFFRIGFNE